MHYKRGSLGKKGMAKINKENVLLYQSIPSTLAYTALVDHVVMQCSYDGANHADP